LSGALAPGLTGLGGVDYRLERRSERPFAATHTIMRPNILFAAGAALGLLALCCETGGVGDPCVPEDEYFNKFSGYKETEVNVESRSFQCETRVCLVNHFRGRVSCPYGQTEEDVASRPGTDGRRCKIPGTSGTNPTDNITVPVPPQLRDRGSAWRARPGASEAVYCSCRCANAAGSKDDGARYCDCPSGYHCAKLVDDLGFGKEQLAGSYCVKDGTDFSPVMSGQPTCDATSKNCGNDGNNF
jgi:hypothetical protein